MWSQLWSAKQGRRLTKTVYSIKQSNMKKIKAFFRKGFNTDTGYFLKPVGYARYETAYFLCKGWVMFWIPGYDRVYCFLDKREAEECLKKANNQK